MLIRQPILSRLGWEGTAGPQTRDDGIEVFAICRHPREGWADDARRPPGQRGDALAWPELTNEGDELVW